MAAITSWKRFPMKSLSESSSVVGTPSPVRISAITVFDNISLSARTPSKSKIIRCFKFYVQRERCLRNLTDWILSENASDTQVRRQKSKTGDRNQESGVRSA